MLWPKIANLLRLCPRPHLVPSTALSDFHLVETTDAPWTLPLQSLWPSDGPEIITATSIDRTLKTFYWHSVDVIKKSLHAVTSQNNIFICRVKKNHKIKLTWPKVGSYLLYIGVMFANFNCSKSYQLFKFQKFHICFGTPL